MSKRGDERIRIDIIWILAIAATSGAVASIYLSWTGQLGGVSGLFSDLLIFISTVLVSYLITNSSERARFEKEMQRLANFSRRRVDLTTANIEALSNELPEIDDLHEMHRLVAFTLRNLAADSGASLKEIEEMGYVEVDETQESYRPQINVPRRSAETPNGVDEGISTETDVTVNCMNCGIANTTNLKAAPGTTKLVECKHCGMEFNVHRLGNGETKVVSKWSNRSSGVGRSTHGGSTVGAPQIIQRKVTPRPVSANCPRCAHLVEFPGKSNRIIDDRFCVGCQANVLHDQETGEISLGQPYQEKFLDHMPEGRFHCDCNLEFMPYFLETDEGEKYFACFSCQTLYRNKAAAKIVIQRECSTPDCVTTLSFKVDTSSGMGKQICYNCKKRFQYDQSKDEVSLVEELNIPEVHRQEWVKTGALCPNCGKPAGQTTLTNASGEKFHMHWDCKYPIQILD